MFVFVVSVSVSFKFGRNPSEIINLKAPQREKASKRGKKRVV